MYAIANSMDGSIGGGGRDFDPLPPGKSLVATLVSFEFLVRITLEKQLDRLGPIASRGRIA